VGVLVELAWRVREAVDRRLWCGVVRQVEVGKAGGVEGAVLGMVVGSLRTDPMLMLTDMMT
jgi:hypothetical protein